MSAGAAGVECAQVLKPWANMLDPSWKSLVTVFDTISAQVLAERLKAEGVPTRLKTDSELFGAARSCEIFVPERLLNRARELLSTSPFSDSELSFLATGELGPDRTEEP